MRRAKAVEQWVRQVLIDLYVEEHDDVCEMYCGIGPDLGKYSRSKIDSYVGIEHAKQFLDACEENWSKRGEPFAAEFIHLDLLKYNIKDYVSKQFDCVICQGRLEHTFVDELRAINFLGNVASVLKEGGFFFGFTTDSSRVYQQVSKHQDPYTHRVRSFCRAGRQHSFQFYPRKPPNSSSISSEEIFSRFFGTLFAIHFHPHSSSSSSEICHTRKQYLVNFSVMQKLCGRVGLDLVLLCNFQNFLLENRSVFETSVISQNLADLKDSEIVGERGLSRGEWDAIGLNCVFCFQKRSLTKN